MRIDTEIFPRYVVLMGDRKLGIRPGECYASDGQNLVRATLRGKKKIIGPLREALATGLFKRVEPLLDYPLVAHIRGPVKRAVHRYEIPKADRAKILKQLWIYAEPPPPLTATRFDLIAEKLFKVGDFIVIRQFESNLVLSPHGGSLIDWAPASWGRRRA